MMWISILLLASLTITTTYQQELSKSILLFSKSLLLIRDQVAVVITELIIVLGECWCGIRKLEVKVLVVTVCDGLILCMYRTESVKVINWKIDVITKQVCMYMA